MKEMESQYFSRPTLLLVAIVSIIISLRNRKKFKILDWFPIYLISFLVAFLANDMLYVLSLRPFFIPCSQYADYIFTLLELLVFSNLYYRIINNQSVKNTILITNMVFFAYFIYMAVLDVDFPNGISELTQSNVYTVEAVLLLLMCLTYFFQVFRSLPYSDIKNEPIFWISAGLLFFVTCTLPHSLLENYIFKNYHSYSFSLYAIFYIFYILLFLMIIRAYSCKPKERYSNDVKKSF